VPGDIEIARVAIKDPHAVSTDVDAYSLSIVEVFNFVQSLKETHKLYSSNLYKSEKRIAPTWIMNLSIYGPIDSDNSNFFIADPYPRLLFVAAAGNGNETHSLMRDSIYTHYDSGDSNVLIVGALDNDHKIADYSNHDQTYVDLYAQGSCVCGDAFKFNGKNPDLENQINGTSQAAPVVATAAKMLAEAFPNWTAQEIKWRLIASSDHLEELREFAKGGELNLSHALKNDPYKTLIITKGGEMTVDYIAPSVSAWKSLLQKKADDEVLRLHAKSSCPDKKTVCFELMHYAEGVDMLVKLPANANLPYSLNGGKTQYIEAGEIKDVIQPFQN
jgi:hypothetical protein